MYVANGTSKMTVSELTVILEAPFVSKLTVILEVPFATYIHLTSPDDGLLMPETFHPGSLTVILRSTNCDIHTYIHLPS
jgi:hypothetical protein